MTDTHTPIALAAEEHRRGDRRRFLGIAAGATLAAGLSACGGSGTSTPTPTPTGTASSTPTPTPTSTVALDVDYLNFALQLQYLEAQYYAWATTGAGIAANLITGTGTQGAVTGGAKVTFTDPILGAYATEIAAGSLAHIGFLRSAIGSASIAAQPAIDISSGATGGFTKLARAAGVIGGTDVFDPYASEENFLLGAFMIQDVVVSAFIGTIPKITSLLYVNAAADMLTTKSYHNAMIREQLYALGGTARTNTDKISDARDALDGSTNLDEGVTGDSTTANIVPTDANGIVFGRTTAQVLNIFYVNQAAVVGGGFYPNGITSTYFNTSGAN